MGWQQRMPAGIGDVSMIGWNERAFEVRCVVLVYESMWGWVMREIPG